MVNLLKFLPLFVESSLCSSPSQQSFQARRFNILQVFPFSREIMRFNYCISTSINMRLVLFKGEKENFSIWMVSTSICKNLTNFDDKLCFALLLFDRYGFSSLVCVCSENSSTISSLRVQYRTALSATKCMFLNSHFLF